MSDFTITIKSNADGIHYYIDPATVKIPDVIAALEITKMMVWEGKKPKEEAKKEALAREQEREMKIGEVRAYNCKRYRCVDGSDSPNCKGCAFEGDDCIVPLGDCSKDLREDGKDVIFVEVKEDEEW